MRRRGIIVAVVALSLATVGYVMGQATGEAALRMRVTTHDWLGRGAWCAALTVAAAAPLPAIRDTLAYVPADAAYADQWDVPDATRRATTGTGQAVVLEHTLPAHYGFDFLASDPTFYPHPCVARFYRVPSITVTPTE